MIEITSIEHEAFNQVKINGVDCHITSPTWSKHYDIMFLSKNKHYHFVHVMHNEGGLIVKQNGGSEQRIHYIFFDTWPKEGSEAAIRFKTTNDVQEMYAFMSSCHFPNYVQSQCEISGYDNQVYWEKIAKFINKYLHTKEEYYTYKTKSLEDMEKGGFLNCKLFCYKWNDELLGRSMASDTYLWGQYVSVVKGLIEFWKNERATGIDVLRLENLLIHIDRAALVMSRPSQPQPLDLDTELKKLLADRKEEEIRLSRSLESEEKDLYWKINKKEKEFSHLEYVLSELMKVETNFLAFSQKIKDCDLYKAKTQEAVLAQKKVIDTQREILLNFEEEKKHLNEYKQRYSEVEAQQKERKDKIVTDKEIDCEFYSIEMRLEKAQAELQKTHQCRMKVEKKQKKLKERERSIETQENQRRKAQENVAILQEEALKAQMAVNKVQGANNNLGEKVIKAQKEVLICMMTPKKDEMERKMKDTITRWKEIVNSEIAGLSNLRVMCQMTQILQYNDIQNMMVNSGLNVTGYLLSFTNQMEIREALIAEKILMKITENLFWQHISKIHSEIHTSVPTSQQHCMVM